MDKQEEYKKLFLSEAREMQEKIDQALLALEKEPANHALIAELFRITHTLKGNAMGMGYEALASMAHVLEDFFGTFNQQGQAPAKEAFEALFRSSDMLAKLIEAVETGEKVSYRGLRKKIELLTTKQTGEKKEPAATQAPVAEVIKTATTANTAPETQSLPQQEIPTGQVKAKEEPFGESPEEKRKEPKSGKPANSQNDYIQVPVSKLDDLLDLVGELIIERDRIAAQDTGSHITSTHNRLNRISSDLQYVVMNIRLVQVGFLFNKFHRLVRDAAMQEGKEVALVLKGTDTEIDRNILQVISDSLVHLLRNAISHGIEDAATRSAQQKPNPSPLVLEAANEGQGVRISISDDGRGMNVDRIRQRVIEKGLLPASLARELPDEQIISYIFEPGFSTSEAVTSLSGRGVGMDVVKSALDRVGGQIEVQSVPGKGTTMHLFMPASMAVKSVLLFEMGRQIYAIPLAATDYVTSLYKNQVIEMHSGLVAHHQNQSFSLFYFDDILRQKNYHSAHWKALHPETEFQVIVVQLRNKRIGLIVDKMLQQKEIVEKPLAKPVDHNELINGVTILGDGQICLVVNISAMINQVFRQQARQAHLS